MNEDETKIYFAHLSDRFMSHMQAMPAASFEASYEDRFVAFIDILGFREIVKSQAANSPNALFHEIINSFWFHSNSDHLEISLLGDAIIMLTKNSNPSSYVHLANSIITMRSSLLERGFLVRGGVAFGKHFSASGITISPAFIDAYEIESRVAKYPRVVCSASVVKQVMPFVTRNKNGRTGIPGPLGFYVLRDQLPLSDSDGEMIIEFLPDTLEPYYLRKGHHHDPFYQPTTEQLEHINREGRNLLHRWRSGLIAARSRCAAPSHFEKVSYIEAKWNNYIKSFAKLDDAERIAFRV